MTLTSDIQCLGLWKSKIMSYLRIFYATSSKIGFKLVFSPCTSAIAFISQGNECQILILNGENLKVSEHSRKLENKLVNFSKCYIVAIQFLNSAKINIWGNALELPAGL